MKARFLIKGRVGGAPSGSMEIDRDRGLATVRPLRSRQTYTLTLVELANIVVDRAVKKGIQ